MGTAFKGIVWLLKNWSTIKTLWSVAKPVFDSLMALFKGETTTEKVQECVGDACRVIKEKAAQPRKGGWLSRRRRR